MKKLGKYELHETVGAGAMSTVYRGTDPDSGETLAIKVLHAHLANTVNRARFEREAHALENLKHPNIIALKGFFRGEGAEEFSVLEYVEGFNLAQWVSREREIDADVAAMILLELVRAIAVAHAKGVIHRDLKPENILIHKDGYLKISDFGLAYLWEGADLTMPGTLVGSPAYMSPEQIRGGKPSSKMDIFSLGILFYFLLTGELPFKGRTRSETFDQILKRTPATPQEIFPHIPKELSDLSLAMMGKNSVERMTTADEVIRSIETYLASVGLTQYEGILRKYLVAPKANRDEVRRQILNGYLKMGKKLVEHGERDRVFDLFRRILSVTGASAASSASDEILPTKKVKIPLPASTRSRILWLILVVVGAFATVYFVRL